MVLKFTNECKKFVQEIYDCGLLKSVLNLLHLPKFRADQMTLTEGEQKTIYAIIRASYY